MTFLGIDLGGTNTKIVVLGEDCSPLARHDFPSRSEAGPERWGASLVEQLDQFGQHAGYDAPTAIGLSVAGLVDDRRRLVQAPNLPAFEGADLAASLRTSFPGVRIVVENDVNAAIVGEHRCGAGRGRRHIAMISLGTGVGGGLILDGKLYRGAHGLGAELGHLVLDHDGPLCACGQPGHVESFLSTAAIVDLARTRMGEAGEAAGLLAAAVARGETPEPRVLARCALDGCSLAREILAECGRWLGIACTNLAHALQPDVILIGGGVSQAGELLVQPAREEFDRRSMRALRGTVPVELAQLGVDGAAIGAALLARESLDVASA